MSVTFGDFHKKRLDSNHAMIPTQDLDVRHLVWHAEG